jgi:hypothetical protein
MRIYFPASTTRSKSCSEIDKEEPVVRTGYRGKSHWHTVIDCKACLPLSLFSFVVTHLKVGEESLLQKGKEPTRWRERKSRIAHLLERAKMLGDDSITKHREARHPLVTMISSSGKTFEAPLAPGKREFLPLRLPPPVLYHFLSLSCRLPETERTFDTTPATALLSCPPMEQRRFQENLSVHLLCSICHEGSLFSIFVNSHPFLIDLLYCISSDDCSRSMV